MSTTQALPTMYDEKIDELSKLTARYQSASQAKAKATDDEKNVQEALMSAMARHGKEVYRDQETGMVVRVEEKQKLSLKPIKQPRG